MKSSVFIALFATSLAAASGLPKNSTQAIVRAVQDQSPEVRTAAAQAIALMPDSSATKPLESALIASGDATEQDAMVKALIAINDSGTVKRLTDAFGNSQLTWGNGAKAKAIDVIAKIGGRKTVKWLTDQLANDQEPAIRAAAIRALAEIGAPPKKQEKS